MRHARVVLVATIASTACRVWCCSPSTAAAAAAGGPLRWSSVRLVDEATLPAHPTALNSSRRRRPPDGLPTIAEWAKSPE
jgi:hypothetical protein